MFIVLVKSSLDSKIIITSIQPMIESVKLRFIGMLNANIVYMHINGDCNRQEQSND